MDEAILIDIVRRFRYMEAVIARADLFLKSNQEDYEKAIKKAEVDFDKHQNYGRFCREANEPEAELQNVMDVRDDLQEAVELCREDMESMQDKIRSCSVAQ